MPQETLTARSSDGESDQPIDIDEVIGWGSDVAAQMLRRLDVPYIALNPGASYRGFHDSIVNHLGNHRPQMLVCLHEEHAVGIAQGYAKATGKPMAVALHSNVGLMHGSMAIFNAWCDRMPMLIIGATGPVDAALRRPWIDWLHTSQDQGALIRNYVKWDDQPGSIEAMPESILRAWQLAGTKPCGPTYVCLDAALQEAPAKPEFAFPDPARFAPADPPAPRGELVRRVAALLRESTKPLFLFGRGDHGRDSMNRRLRLVEAVRGQMLSDLKTHTLVPSDHPAHVGEPFTKLAPAAKSALQQSDLIISFGWVDLGGILRQAFGAKPVTAKIVHAGQDLYLHNGWGKETFQLPPIDVHLLADPDVTVSALVDAMEHASSNLSYTPKAPPKRPERGESLNLVDVATRLSGAVGNTPVTFAALCRGWPSEHSPLRESMSYLGKDGGGGIGSGPSLSIGAALALKDSDRLTISILGDGDTLMGINAFWTAARYSIPLLAIVANNRSYYNDELHQEGIARTRCRAIENRWIGQSIDNPIPDIAAIVKGFGVGAIGPITDHATLDSAILEAVLNVRAGRPFLLDVHIDPGHGRELTESMAERSLAKAS